MTREEAIKILKQRECCRECVANCTCNECDKAFEMAIEALKQEPCEDTISRKMGNGFQLVKNCQKIINEF